ncbi:hypothetical protein [Burkholderia ubonensis]|uniref:hypothetical protein n=1 Tax=Burkholderia ubonensis TaxID=101571 RepID=UPI0012F8A056|nr:hypothetical protein [Burkholderia ubonensis]
MVTDQTKQLKMLRTSTASAARILLLITQLVAARDMGRRDAIQAATEWFRQEGEAVGDVTGVAAIENEFPSPSKAAPDRQVGKIASELLDAARDAADTL